jgi:hypothetical protein
MTLAKRPDNADDQGMGRLGGWVMSGTIAGALVLGTWVLAPAGAVDVTGSGLNLPIETTVPTLPPVTVTVPEVTVPTIPDVTVPTIPGVTVPPVSVPTVTTPTVPTVTIPTIPPLPVSLPPVPATVPGGVLSNGLVECAHFVTQQAAQAALLVDARLAALLDDDHDGVACELLPSGPATVPAPTTASPSTAKSAGGAATAAVGAASSGAAPSGGPDVHAAGSDPVGAGATGAASGAGTAGTGAAKRTASGDSSVDVAGAPLSSNHPLGGSDGGGGNAVLTMLAFVLLLGAAAGTAREVAATKV